MSALLSAWEAEHEHWLGDIVLDAAIWNDDHSAVVAMDISILRGHVSTMLARLRCECCQGVCACGGRRLSASSRSEAAPR